MNSMDDPNIKIVYKKHVCPFCEFRTHKKYNLDMHKRNKHKNEILDVHSHRYDGQAQVVYQQPIQQHQAGGDQPVHGGQTSVVYQQHVQEHQTGEQHPLDAVHHHPVQQHQAGGQQPVYGGQAQAFYPPPVQAHQTWTQQQGGRVRGLHQQHDQEHAQVNGQPQYQYVELMDLDFLTLKNNIEYLLWNKKDFLGCFPLDRLPPFPTQFPKSIIINTDKSTLPGTHWVALVLTEKECYYFDSFGLPIIEENIKNYLEPHYKTSTYSNRCIQDISSSYCGAYCVCFIQWVNNDVAFKNFLNHFEEGDLLSNDKKLRKYFKGMLFKV
jgi:hypothetical protein